MKEDIKRILLDTFLDFDNESDLTDDLSLVGGGLLDSISILQLVDQLESKFDIEFEAHEIDREKFDSVNLILKTVEEKQKA